MQKKKQKSAAHSSVAVVVCSSNQAFNLDENRGHGTNFYMYLVSSRIDFGKDIIFCQYCIH